MKFRGLFLLVLTTKPFEKKIIGYIIKGIIKWQSTNIQAGRKDWLRKESKLSGRRSGQL